MAAYGPDNAELTVHTKRAGAAAAAGHDLTIRVERWRATLGDDGLVLEAFPSSLRVVEGHGGITPLGDGERATIEQRMEDLLPDAPIVFRDGRLTLNGVTRPVEYRFDGAEGRAELRQTDFGIKPFSALFGALKVADTVEIRVKLT